MTLTAGPSATSSGRSPAPSMAGESEPAEPDHEEAKRGEAERRTKAR
jgi:hypothetical protein